MKKYILYPSLVFTLLSCSSENNKQAELDALKQEAAA